MVIYEKEFYSLIRIDRKKIDDINMKTNKA